MLRATAARLAAQAVSHVATESVGSIDPEIIAMRLLSRTFVTATGALMTTIFNSFNEYGGISYVMPRLAQEKL